jgi:hypothetical protein
MIITISQAYSLLHLHDSQGFQSQLRALELAQTVLKTHFISDIPYLIRLSEIFIYFENCK